MQWIKQQICNIFSNVVVRKTVFHGTLGQLGIWTGSNLSTRFAQSSYPRHGSVTRVQNIPWPRYYLVINFVKSIFFRQIVEFNFGFSHLTFFLFFSRTCSFTYVQVSGCCQWGHQRTLWLHWNGSWIDLSMNYLLHNFHVFYISTSQLEYKTFVKVCLTYVRVHLFPYHIFPQIKLTIIINTNNVVFSEIKGF